LGERKREVTPACSPGTFLSLPSPSPSPSLVVYIAITRRGKFAPPVDPYQKKKKKKEEKEKKEKSCSK